MSSADVAIVHDYLNQRGGAERVVLEMSEMWPRAPIYTSLYRPQSTFPDFQGRDIRTSPLDRLPVDRGFRNLFALYPAAFRSLGEIDAEVILASSSGWAHMVHASPDAMLAVYCYTPARWLYGEEYFAAEGSHLLRLAMVRSALGLFRSADRRAARRADLYIAISEHVRQRIRSTYGIDASLVYPPVEVSRFRPRVRGTRLLAVSRLLPYKHVELFVNAASRLGIGLDVVGDGPMLSSLREAAGPSVTFHGSIDEQALVELFEGCRAVCVGAEEDFGIVAVEAQAAGKPVIAYGRGGSLETVEEGVTGVFFGERTEASVIDAFLASERLDTSPERIAEHARRFSAPAFRMRLEQVLSEAREARRSMPYLDRRNGTGLRARERGLPGADGAYATVRRSIRTAGSRSLLGSPPLPEPRLSCPSVRAQSELPRYE